MGNMATCAGCGVRVRSDTTTGRHKCAQRENLRVPCVHSQYDAHTFLSPGGDPESSIAYQQCPGGRPVTDAELAQLGLVALDGIDVEALAVGVRSDGPLLREMNRHNAEEFVEAIAVVVSSARLLLAAIAKEDTP